MRKATQFGTVMFWAKTLQIVLLCLVTAGMLGAGRSQYDRIGHELMCSCGCGQILLECNHVGCPDSAGMIRELQNQVSSGASDTVVLNWFAVKYGPTVLAAPIRGGFDNAAWIIPIGVFLLATAGTFVVVWHWRKRSALSLAPAAAVHTRFTAPIPPEETALRDRIRRETEY